MRKAILDALKAKFQGGQRISFEQDCGQTLQDCHNR